MTLSLPIERVTANGLEFAYLAEGPADGPLALLMHGFPDTAHTWDDLRPRLAAKGYRAVSPWSRGYQPTAIPERDADAETLARDLLGLITALGADKAVLIGHDFGAAAAYGAAAIDPARVSKLFTIGIPHPATLRPTPRKLWLARHFLLFKLGGAPARFCADDFAALPAIYKRWSPAWTPPPEELEAIRACFADPASCNAAFGYYRELRFVPEPFLREKISVPTVVFSGLDDDLVSPADYERGGRMFSGSYKVETMRGGHFMHREHPAELAEKLLPHL
jgi:pimeloyl-ACP methyl ester carboxylesterase